MMGFFIEDFFLLGDEKSFGVCAFWLIFVIIYVFGWKLGFELLGSIWKIKVSCNISRIASRNICKYSLFELYRSKDVFKKYCYLFQRVSYMGYMTQFQASPLSLRLFEAITEYFFMAFYMNNLRFSDFFTHNTQHLMPSNPKVPQSIEFSGKT